MRHTYGGKPERGCPSFNTSHTDIYYTTRWFQMCIALREVYTFCTFACDSDASRGLWPISTLSPPLALVYRRV